MEKNQYIISSKKIPKAPENFTLRTIDNLYIYKHPDLQEIYHQSNNVSILLFGFIFSYKSPTQTTSDIVAFFTKFECKDELFKAVEDYSGRYLIIYKNETDLVIFHDMFGQRQINYTRFNEELIISSSEKLLVEVTTERPHYIPDHQQLINDRNFLFFDQWLLGDFTWDINIKKLLPNHYINFHKKEVNRLPFFPIENISENEVIEYCGEVVKGNFEAVTNHYQTVFQALTSGYDSRTLLAFSKKHWNSIQFYTFTRGDANSKRDNKVAKILSDKFGFNHQSIFKLKQNNQFENWYISQFLRPRTTPKFYNILFFKNLKSKNAINITGDGVQMVRNLRSPEQLESVEILFNSIGYQHHTFHLNNFSEWLVEAKLYAEKNGILISDLFTQEIAQGQLTARWAHEFDLSGCEEFNPFNHKKMIYTILKNIPYEQRLSPTYSFQKKLMETQLKGVTKIEFNPPTWKDFIKKIIRK